MDLFSEDRKIYSLSEIAGSIKVEIQTAFPEPFWVIAEIAKLNRYPKTGHCYPDLVEKSGPSLLTQMRGTIWSRSFNAINNKFKIATGEELGNDMKVLLLAEISFHEVYGLSLNIIDIEPSFTLGEMARQKAATIETLKKKGIFNLNKQMDFPIIPQRIAVISIETSKGYNDFILTLNKNPYGYRFVVKLFPAILQGEKALSTISNQLNMIETERDHFDVVTIIRGGGDEVGLSAYDSQVLAEKVALCPLPVITGIGHSTNETVVEMVAHLNMITPTEVAYSIIERFKKFEDGLNRKLEKLLSQVNQFVQIENYKLTGLSSGLKDAANDLNQEVIKRITLDSAKLKHAVKQQFAGFNFNLVSNINAIRSKSEKQIHNLMNGLYIIDQKLQLSDPLNILKKGYSITTYKGKIVTSADQLNVDDEITTLLKDGKVKSNVKSIHKNDGKEN